MGWTTLSARGVLEEVLRNRQAEEDGDASDEEVAHGVHVGELQQGEPHRSWNRKAKQKKTSIPEARNRKTVARC